MTYQIQNTRGLFLEITPNGAKWGCAAMGAQFQDRAEALATARKHQARAVRCFIFTYRCTAPDGTARNGKAPFYGVSGVEAHRAFTAAMLREGFTQIFFEVSTK